MNYKKIHTKLIKLESEYKILFSDLKNHKIISSKPNYYLKEDKESFKKLWKKYITFFDKLKKLMKASKYRKWIIFIDHNKLVLLRYMSIFYFNTLVDLIKIFGKHEEFIRVFLDENFSKDYGYYARNIYKPKFVNLINTPSIFLESAKTDIDKDLYKLLNPNKVYIKKTKRIVTDYKNIYFYIKYRVDKVLEKLVQKIGYVIARTRFSTRKGGLITKKNLEKYLSIAKPGDILLTRGNWNASNISIPYFWKHMSMYIGNGKFLKRNFDFKFLNDLDNKTEYIIEATGEGIKIVELDHLAFNNDYLGVSRTSFKKEKVNRSIKNSLEHIGKTYDNLFNFHSDKSLVCSELIMKAYAKETKKDEGIEIELDKIGISLTYPPNKFVEKLYKETFNKKPIIFPVFFIDSIEKTHKNFISTNKNFLKSRKRAKLSIFLK